MKPHDKSNMIADILYGRSKRAYEKARLADMRERWKKRKVAGVKEAKYNDRYLWELDLPTDTLLRCYSLIDGFMHKTSGLNKKTRLPERLPEPKLAGNMYIAAVGNDVIMEMAVTPPDAYGNYVLSKMKVEHENERWVAVKVSLARAGWFMLTGEVIRGIENKLEFIDMDNEVTHVYKGLERISRRPRITLDNFIRSADIIPEEEIPRAKAKEPKKDWGKRDYANSRRKELPPFDPVKNPPMIDPFSTMGQLTAQQLYKLERLYWVDNDGFVRRRKVTRKLSMAEMRRHGQTHNTPVVLLDGVKLPLMGVALFLGHGSLVDKGRFLYNKNDYRAANIEAVIPPWGKRVEDERE